MKYWNPQTEIVKNHGDVVIANQMNGTWMRVSGEVFGAIECLRKIKDGDRVEFEDIEDEEYLASALEFLEHTKALTGDKKISIQNKTVSIEMTHRCNLHCVHCCMDANNSQESWELNTEEMKELLKKCVAWNPRSIMLSGGEPLIRKDFAELLIYLRGIYQGKIIVSTNGTLVTEAKARLLAKNADQIDLSVDGVDEETTSKVRGPGVFDKVMQAISQLQENCFTNLSLSMATADRNEYLDDQFDRLCEKLQVKPVKRKFSPVGRGEESKELNREVLIGFHGVEPFLNFGIVHYFVIKLKEKLGEKVSFAATTNGTVLNEEEMEFAGKQIQGLSVSLDGDEETHDGKRKDASGRGSHQRALYTAKIFQKYKSNLRVRMTFDHKNVRKLYDNICFLAGQGFRCLVANPDFYDQDWEEEDLRIMEEEIRKVKERFEKEEILISLLEPMHLYCLGDCKGGITGQHIFPDGKLYPCLLAGGKPEFENGDIENGVDQAKLGSILSHAGELHEECKDCALTTGCDGARCMIINKVVMREWASPIPIQCWMNRVRYELNGIR